DYLLVTSEMTGSGTVHFPWPNKRLGLTFLATETLCERDRPYHLVKELARGQLGRIIRRFVELVYIGFKPTDKLKRTIRLEMARFGILATSDETSDQMNPPAQELLDRLVQLSFNLNDLFLEQSLAFRKLHSPQFPIHMGVHLDIAPEKNEVRDWVPHTDRLKDLFRIINATPTWRELEPEPDVYRWELFDRRIALLRENGFSAVGGPILQFDAHSIPKWVLPQIGDGTQLERFALKYVDTFLEHFSGKVDLWILTSKVNSHQLDACPVNRLIDLTKQAASVFGNHGLAQPAVVGIDQPWGDYLLHQDTPCAPFSIVEELLGIPEPMGIMLDVNIGLSSKCSYPRDPMAFSAMIDQWSLFGKSLYFSLGIPSELGTNPDFPDEYVGLSFEWSRKTQQEWVHRYIPILFSKRSVAGIFWNRLEDSEFSEFTNFGLLDTFGRQKPAYRKLASLCGTYLQ
ncbi:MAG: hypothetical protein FWD31_06975, partial [Planctomycetaceae bacterium]|nr:hypothetical protein [Planctomycetaceae bacterium]